VSSKAAHSAALVTTSKQRSRHYHHYPTHRYIKYKHPTRTVATNPALTLRLPAASQTHNTGNSVTRSEQQKQDQGL